MTQPRVNNQNLWQQFGQNWSRNDVRSNTS